MAAFEALMLGLKSWDIPKSPTPCELLLVGESAFPVLVNDRGQVLIAGSFYGQGRLVVMAHESYLLEACLAPFLRNVVNWLCPSPGARVGVHRSVEALVAILQCSGVKAQVQQEPGDPLGVYCINAYNECLAEELVQFVKSGGGLLIGGHAWHWANEHGREHVLSKFPGNQVTSVAGVYFTDTYSDISQFKISKKIPKIPLEVRCGEELQQDQNQLLKGICELDIRMGGIPSQLLVHGALAFPLGLDASLSCFLAAARYGRGRVVLAAHEGMLLTPKLGPFLLNAIRWLSRGQTGKVGVDTELKDLYALLSEHGVECSLEPRVTSCMAVYCCKAYSNSQAKQLQEFVAEGGGLLIGGQAWTWAARNPDCSALACFPGNNILNCFGLSILPQTLNPGCFPVPTPEMRSYHFRKALLKFQASLNHGGENLEKSWMKKLELDGAAFLQIPAEKAPAYISIHRYLRKMLKVWGIPAVSPKHPVASGSREAAVLHLATELVSSGTDCTELMKELQTKKLDTSWAPSDCPITVDILGNNPGKSDSWVSTGLYIPNGQKAEVSLSAAAASAGLKVQIGCHTDDLTNASKLCRAPVVTRQWCMGNTTQSISCLWGGLLYVILPKGSNLGPISVTVKGAVPAPYYKLGKTSLEEWRSCIQEIQAPWGELETDNIILTVPTANLQALEDPEPVLRLWDEIMQAIAKLASQPFPFHRPERIVADVQISSGWMHSGYPIMCHVQSVKELISETHIRRRGLWGPMHELGHNQQHHGWEFPPNTTEATCNLWSIYVHETVLDIPRAQAHQALCPQAREKRIREYLKEGAPLCKWDTWTALETYLQLQEAFGWESFTCLFAEYQNLVEIPKDNVGKMNLWVMKFSKKVQKNLIPFFEAWGWPIQKEVTTSLACLPWWEENPLWAYIHAEK
ncbi:PREDICTED: TRPM8 channel-associated factor 2-like [Miniopterus natalensis]|uniref:TRPM8 channel-associated factor 2-like n=1 Tax=Miniopterus natalensis TaxID=291302 RepID=UPI0007A6F965|nr:PREDICTED: TRPM8 channel-associated factor 2-like [Miniopterus natalensis]